MNAYALILHLKHLFRNKANYSPNTRSSDVRSWDAKLAAFAVVITFACALLFWLAPAVKA